MWRCVVYFTLKNFYRFPQTPIITHFYIIFKDYLARKLVRLGKNMTIKQLIKESGLKQNYIAEYVDISEQSLCHKLKGRRRFTEEELERLSEILEVSPRIIRRANRLTKKQ